MSIQFATIQTTVAPTNGVDEVVELDITGTPSGGDFTITFGGDTTAAIGFDATAAEVQAALEAIDAIGSGNVACTGGPLPDATVTITGAGDLAGLDLGTFTSTDSLTGGTDPASGFTVATSGVRGSYRGAPAGCLLITTNGVGSIYDNEGTSNTPVWVQR